MKLLPFDLERALAGDPVVTTKGEKVDDIYFTNKSADYPVVVLIEGKWDCCTKDGGFLMYSGSELRMPQKAIKIGDREVPAPMQVKPEIGETYYVAYPNSRRTGLIAIWENESVDNNYFDIGLVYSDIESATEAGIALSELIKKTMKGE